MVFFSEANRILLQNKTGKLLGEITFPNVGENTVEIDQTFVDSSLRGQGMAGKLVELAVEQIKSEGKQASPTCTYVQKAFKENPKYQSLVPKQ